MQFFAVCIQYVLSLLGICLIQYLLKDGNRDMEVCASPFKGQLSHCRDLVNNPLVVVPLLSFEWRHTNTVPCIKFINDSLYSSIK